VPDLPENLARLKNVRMELWLHSTATGADFEKVGNSVISRIGDPSIGDPSMRKRIGISLTSDERLMNLRSGM
jgi:hypothetical protein